MLAKKTSKNRITIPKDIVKNFPDTEYFNISMDNDQILLRPVHFSTTGSSIEKAKAKMKKLGITEKDVEEAIIWAGKGSK